MNRTPVLMTRPCFRNSVRLGRIAKCAVHGVGKLSINLSIWLCNGSSDKLCIDLDLDCDMSLYWIRYRGHQTQVKGQTHLKGTTAILTRPGSGKLIVFQAIISSIMVPSHTLHHNAHKTLAYKWLLALVAVYTSVTRKEGLSGPDKPRRFTP